MSSAVRGRAVADFFVGTNIVFITGLDVWKVTSPVQQQARRYGGEDGIGHGEHLEPLIAPLKGASEIHP